MASTKIDWTEKTWNPVTGCTKISAGCKHCYAERMAKRLQLMGQKRYSNGFAVREHPDALDVPHRWKKPAMIFVNSMGDLLHTNVSDGFIRRVLGVMAKSNHTYQVLTKRAGRLINFDWPDNAWVGVSVENKNAKWRIESLSEVRAKTKFVSFEPLLEDLGQLDLYHVDWAIVGCESGPRKRPMSLDWVRNVRNQCEEFGTAFFFKQAVVDRKVCHKPLLDGVRHLSYPQ